MVSWWTQTELCAELGIEESLRTTMGKELNQIQISYQIARTKMGDVRRKQTVMLLDSSIETDEVERFHAENVAKLSAKMSELNFQARILARRSLSKAQLTTIAEKYPQFFSTRWFRMSQVKMRQGAVKVIKK